MKRSSSNAAGKFVDPQKNDLPPVGGRVINYSKRAKHNDRSEVHRENDQSRPPGCCSDQANCHDDPPGVIPECDQKTKEMKSTLCGDQENNCCNQSITETSNGIDHGGTPGATNQLSIEPICGRTFLKRRGGNQVLQYQVAFGLAQRINGERSTAREAPTSPHGRDRRMARRTARRYRLNRATDARRASGTATIRIKSTNPGKLLVIGLETGDTNLFPGY